MTATSPNRGGRPHPGPVTAATRYEPVAAWAKIPHGIWLREATSVAVDEDDRVYVFNRGNMPVLVFDPDGNLVDAWGNETPHAGMTQITDPYGAEVSYVEVGSRLDIPREMVSLRKWRRVSG